LITTVLTGVVLAATAPAASAQVAAWDDRGFLAVTFGGQVSSTSFDESVTFTEFVEEGTFESDYEVGSGAAFDIGGGYRVWRNLAAGISISRFSHKDPATASIRAPHPFFFNRHREFTAELDDMERQEVGVHLQAVYMLPLSDSIRVMVSGGPSFFSVKQDIVTGVAYSEAFPFDALVSPSATIETADESTTGFNLGADLTWMIGERWGVGGGVKFTRGSLDLTVSDDRLDDRDLSIDVGGTNIGGGIRFFF
jgi:hypothetical protein